VCVSVFYVRERGQRVGVRNGYASTRRDATRYDARTIRRQRSAAAAVEVGGYVVEVGGCAVEVGRRVAGADETILTIVPRRGSWSMVGMAGADATIQTILTIVLRGGSWSMVGMAGADATILTILTIVSRRGSWSMVGVALEVTEVRAGGEARAGHLTIPQESSGTVWSVWSHRAAQSG
jgi:hypothetical protein